ncbi:MAG: LacI family DNA-binding transcriptional regulator [Chloroflexi bacterium]|nr:LacI family DNA-binding transcriptional regulator [Chloroflexota bacterium]
MADVAERAGVSIATVSRALSGDGRRVSSGVLERVLQAAEDLRYHPNNLARNMRSGSSRIFGLVISDIGNPFFTAVARGAEDVAQRHGYSLVLANTDENPEREAATLNAMAAERAAGVMVATTNENVESLRRLHSIGVPIVAIDRRIAGLPTDSVAVDNETAAYEAVTHLIRLGHERIAMVGGPHDAKTARERYLGYERAFRHHRLEVRPELFREGNFRELAAQVHTQALLELADPPTAIFSVNNLTTIGVLKALREAGVALPGRMSLVGFDDLPTAELLDPPLTVVQQPTYQMGAQAAELLVRRLEDPVAPVEKVLLAGTLVVRGSTAPPPPPTNGGLLS